MKSLFFFPSLKTLFFSSLQVHGPRALRGSRSAVVHQNLCQVQEKHRGTSNWSVYQSARLDQRRSAELRIRASLPLVELQRLNLPLSISNHQDEAGLEAGMQALLCLSPPCSRLVFPSFLLSLIVVSLVLLYTSCFSAPRFFSHSFPSLRVVSPFLCR